MINHQNYRPKTKKQRERLINQLSANIGRFYLQTFYVRSHTATVAAIQFLANIWTQAERRCGEQIDFITVHKDGKEHFVISRQLIMLNAK